MYGVVNAVELFGAWIDVLLILRSYPEVYFISKGEYKSGNRNPVTVTISVYPVPKLIVPLMDKLLRKLARSVSDHISAHSPKPFKVYSDIDYEEVKVGAQFHVYKDNYMYEFMIGFECINTDSSKPTNKLFIAVNVIDNSTDNIIYSRVLCKEAEDVSEEIIMDLYDEMLSVLKGTVDRDLVDKEFVRYVAESLMYMADRLIEFGRKAVKDIPLYMMYP